MNNEQKRLQYAVDELPRDIQPERDLWQGIELGIERRAVAESQSKSDVVALPKFSQWHYSAAASFVAVVVIAWMGMQQLSAPVGQQSTGVIELAELLTEQHQAQKQQLLVSLQSEQPLTENWQEQLAELDDAAIAIKAALAQDPNNAALLKMLQNVYQQQMSLIERVHSPKWREI